VVTPASGQVLTHRDLYRGQHRADRHGHLQGERLPRVCPSSDNNGEVLVQIRGDGVPPHTMENSFKKAFTARTFRIPSGEMEERLKKNPRRAVSHRLHRGALPITIGEELIGAAGALELCN
jgi:Haem-degrading